MLSEQERASLCEVGKLLGRTIPNAHRDSLIKVGLVKEVTGGLKLTDIGEGAAFIARGGTP
jgi:hypothetical protein